MWFELKDPDQVPSPSLLLYPDRIAANIQTMIQLAGSAERLVPHVKTHKMAEVVRMQLAAGITKFKCATIAEAEMLADAGATWVLLAYQLVGPNLKRYLDLAEAFHHVQFGSLVDSRETATALNEHYHQANKTAIVFIDVNNGMDRSGHPVDEDLEALYHFVLKLPNLRLLGLHVYDGHIRDENFDVRKTNSDQAFGHIDQLRQNLGKAQLPDPIIIAGGSPTFNVHVLRDGIYCSPGTCLLWDWGYGDRFLDQPFQHAAVLLTRVISKPSPGIVTVDLGHKAVSAENPIDLRFRFLNLNDYRLRSQSEEHGVVEVPSSTWEEMKAGDVLYALPYHICPTVALHAKAYVIQEGTCSETWEVVARSRQLTY
ncbi:D-serine deaminase-like pyridoxal phosphate-dependent protein [Rhabdobacter roseus]|uniref:D-serine deaminase-like pyridoxal phosphate-dependent protein n=1 Tax=Rhabdobacter roseus TaxID=1655419 RepID=A0A840TNM1_9BACT|nr:D-TA family PLP-dependent enzyme [Rhabdobacter roseus]MBB5283152.1 D-serine deaminase-like pyridoxal phosphate-dependent protein [Rhabdobacter roseus]